MELDEIAHQAPAHRGRPDPLSIDGLHAVLARDCLALRFGYPDGLTPSLRIRAAFSDRPFTFNNSMGAVRDLQDDESLMRFLAVYLCSDLAAYWTLLTAPTPVLERPQVKASELTTLPFWVPERTPHPTRARAAVREIAQWSRQQAPIDSDPRAPLLPNAIEDLLHEYFGLDERLRRIVYEAREQVFGAVQPTTVQNFPTTLQLPPSRHQLQDYARTLLSELERYRDGLGGQGQFETEVRTWHAGLSGYAIVTVRTGAPAARRTLLSAGIDELLAQLRTLGLLDLQRGDHGVTADVFVRAGDAIAFAKPLINRLWLTSAALDDANRLVAHVQRQYGHAAIG